MTLPLADNKFAIIGGGFGLYGYMPALVEGCGVRVLLPERYRARVRSRPDIQRFESTVDWCATETEAIEQADGVVIASRPDDQAGLVPKLVERAKIKWLLLEKPLSATAVSAGRLLDLLIKSKKTFRIGYNFRYTSWGRQLLETCRDQAGGRISIEWKFLAHHFKMIVDTWKRVHSQGGGVIKFYGIHVIALLAEIGYRTVAESSAAGELEDEFDVWRATFSGPALPTCTIAIDTRFRDAVFRVTRVRPGEAEETVFDEADPFDATPAPGHQADRRVSILIAVCRSLLQDDTRCPPWYLAANELWQAVETCTRFDTSRHSCRSSD